MRAWTILSALLRHNRGHRMPGVRAQHESCVTSRGSDGGNCRTHRRIRLGRPGFRFRIGLVRHWRRPRANSDFCLPIAAVRRAATSADARGGGDLDRVGSAERGGLDPQAAGAEQSRFGIFPHLGRGNFAGALIGTALVPLASTKVLPGDFRCVHGDRGRLRRLSSDIA